MSELKNCPFCGGEAYVRNSAGGWYVRCKNPKRYHRGYKGNAYYPACFMAHTKAYGWDTKEEAIEAWNTRAERTCEVASGYVDSREKWFECTECGLTDYALKGGSTLFDYEYCPKCGTKLVE